MSIKLKPARSGGIKTTSPVQIILTAACILLTLLVLAACSMLQLIADGSEAQADKMWAARQAYLDCLDSGKKAADCEHLRNQYEIERDKLKFLVGIRGVEREFEKRGEANK